MQIEYVYMYNSTVQNCRYVPCTAVRRSLLSATTSTGTYTIVKIDLNEPNFHVTEQVVPLHFPLMLFCEILKRIHYVSKGAITNYSNDDVD